jgi:hypothetical protein
MAEVCNICQHAKIESINAALASGRAPGLVRAQYRLDQQMLEDHLEHRTASDKGLVNEPLSTQPLRVALHRAPTQELREQLDCNGFLDQALLSVTENPWRQFTHGIDIAVEAYHLAHDDPKMQARMQERLEEKVKLMLRSEDMGIS